MGLALLILASLAAANSPADPGSADIRRVAWLQGCWEQVTPERTVEEQWMAPRGRSMLGTGRTVQGDRLVDYEFVLIREQGNRLAYEAHPSGQPAAIFLSTTLSDALVVFEDPEHDFPQLIGYRRGGPDALLAWIEGTQKGQKRRLEFPYRRAACPGPGKDSSAGSR